MRTIRRVTLLALTLLAGTQPAWAARTPSCGTDVGLVVTLDGTQTATTADATYFPLATDYKMVSDGGGAYVNGTKSKGGTLEAILQVSNCTYDFTLNLNNLQRKAYARDQSNAWVQMTFFNIDRVASVPVLGATLSSNAQAFCSGVVLDPSNPNLPYTDPATGIVYDNYGGCAFDSAVGQYYVRRAANFSLGSFASSSSRYQFNPPMFGNGSIINNCTASDARCTTSYVRVYHSTVNAWTIVPDDVPQYEPSTPPTPDDWVAAHQTCGNTCVIDGYVSLPLKITMTRQ